MTRLGIIGDVLCDYTLSAEAEDKMRLGGIVHAARGAWALGMEYRLFSFSPAYLDEHIQQYSIHHLGTCNKIGDITGAPNVILIKEAKEVCNQGYELILRERSKYQYDLAALEDVVKAQTFTDFLIFSGSFELTVLNETLKDANAKIHIDVSNDIKSFEPLQSLQKKFETVFLSTSSDLFLQECCADINKLLQKLDPYTHTLIFKENRGGSRYFNLQNGQSILIPSQTKPIVHSVGVGDNFDVAYIWAREVYQPIDALHFASWVAMEYASTTWVDNFKQGVQRTIAVGVESLKELGGVSLPWEKRKALQIYIAAPDFSYEDTAPIRLVENALKYHNFSPRLPIAEHGQLTTASSPAERAETCDKDIELLHGCNIVVGVILNNDPGTLMELGYAIALGKPTIVYDPKGIAKNCILENLPRKVSSNLDEVIAEVFYAGLQLTTV